MLIAEALQRIIPPDGNTYVVVNTETGKCVTRGDGSVVEFKYKESADFIAKIKTEKHEVYYKVEVI